jgi:hypothetical protein
MCSAGRPESRLILLSCKNKVSESNLVEVIHLEETVWSLKLMQLLEPSFKDNNAEVGGLKLSRQPAKVMQVRGLEV